VSIERQTDANGTFAVIAAVDSGITNYSDTSIASGHLYIYRIRALNLAGYSPYSNEAVALVNQLPTCALSSPTNGAVFISPANIPLAATASDSDGTIANVVFYVGGTTNLGYDTNSPYSLTWTNVLHGVYSLTASATDNLGGVTNSAPVIITVSNPPPSVSLSSPTNNQFYFAPAIITISASASDTNGSISKVDFYVGTTNLIGTDTSSPYTMSWTNLITGNYPLTAVATDNEGASSTSSVVNIIVSNTPPTISIVSPTNNALFQSPGIISLAVNANDANGFVAKVGYYYGGTNLIGESTASPFSLIWTNVASGTNSVTAKATDDGGATTISSAITVIINAQPTISITNPVNGATFNAQANVAINAIAADSDGSISKVDFYYGINNLIGSDTSAPYTFTLTNAPSGTYPLTARVSDNRGGVTISTPVTISVGTNLSDIADSYVRDGSSTNINFGTSTTLLVQTNGTPGNNCDTYLKFDLSGVANVSKAQLNIYAAVSANNNTLGVTVCGTSTNWTESGIKWTNRPSLGPIISGTNFSGKSLAWYVLDVGPYLQSQKAAGSNVVSLALHATNTTSANVSINSKEATANQPYLQLFTTNVPPTVSITSPTNYTTYAPATNITITANAADIDGRIYQVQFFQGTTSLGMATNSPFTFTWTNVPPGAYALTAVATDNFGASTASSAIYAIVSSDPNTTDSDGDGIPDGWEALYGFDPTTADWVQSGKRANYGYTLADWLNQVTGVKSGSVSLDNEGNVISVSQ
jgi:hypothetical protein